MAFQYMTGGSVDLFNLIFNQILKVSPTVLDNYNVLQDQVLHFILLPHVILFLFLFGFGQAVVPEHKGLKYLVMAVTYIFIIMQGWYGTFLIPLLEGWFTITLIFGLFLFFATRILHPATAQRIGMAAAKLAKDAGKEMGKEKQMEKLADELEHITREIENYKQHEKQNPGAARIVAQLMHKRYLIERKIKELEK